MTQPHVSGQTGGVVRLVMATSRKDRRTTHCREMPPRYAVMAAAAFM